MQKIRTGDEIHSSVTVAALKTPSYIAPKTLRSENATDQMGRGLTGPARCHIA